MKPHRTNTGRARARAHSARAGTRAGMTLLEMTVSLAIIGLVTASLASVLALTARATPTGNDSGSVAASQAAALQDVADELSAATRVLLMDTRSITIEVADRDSDGTPEQIRYSWDATPGSPLLRAYNADPALPHVAGVEALVLSWDTSSRAIATGGSSNVEGPEVVLASNLARPLPDFRNLTNAWIAQQIVPELPEDATAYRVTRFRTFARLVPGRTPVLRALLCDEVLGMPASLFPLRQQTGDFTGIVSSTSADAQVTFTFTSPPTRGPTQPLWVVIRPEASANGVVTPFDSEAPDLGRAGYGVNSAPLDADFDHAFAMRYEALGHVTRPVPDTAIVTFLAAMRLDVRTAALGRTQLSVRPLNPLRMP